MHLPVWVNAALVLAIAISVAAYVGLRATIAAEAPDELWIWDVSWLLSIAILVSIPILLGRLVIETEADALIVRFGFVSLGVVRFPLTEIEQSRPVRYRPIREFGGWGYRVGRHEGETTIVYSLRGAAGVLLRLREPRRALFRRTDRVLVGSLRPRALADTLARLRS